MNIHVYYLSHRCTIIQSVDKVQLNRESSNTFTSQILRDGKIYRRQIARWIIRLGKQTLVKSQEILRA